MTLVGAAAPPEIRRDRWGRPYIKQPKGNEIAYQRVTTFAGLLESTYNIDKWRRRLTLDGAAMRPELVLAYFALAADDKAGKERILDELFVAGGGETAATVGTSMHRLCERIDRGEDLGIVPGDFQRDLDAYVRATADWSWSHIEAFVVLDELQVAGSADRFGTFAIDDENYVADIKTGSLDYGVQKMAVQLALYAHGQLYDVATGERTPLPAVNGQRGVIIHLPAGAARCELHWLDIAAGWDAARGIYAGAREWSKRKNLLTPINAEAAFGNLERAGLVDVPDLLAAQLEAAGSVAELGRLWHEHKSNGWTDSHTRLAAARKAAITTEGATA